MGRPLIPLNSVFEIGLLDTMVALRANMDAHTDMQAQCRKRHASFSLDKLSAGRWSSPPNNGEPKSRVSATHGPIRNIYNCNTRTKCCGCRVRQPV